MKNFINLSLVDFSTEEKLLVENENFKLTTFKYPSGVKAIKLKNSKGYIVVLPYYGQIIWDAEFLGHSLRMKNMFNEPKIGDTIIDTYGCFAFHSGLIRNGCPSPEDDHPIHGEMPCAKMDRAWVELDDESISICGAVEYVKGFGDHYLAQPKVTLFTDSSLFNIEMNVSNLASVPMPLQYMCHMNYCYENGARFSQNIPSESIHLRETIPAHVKPTEKWLEFNTKIKNKEYILDQLIDNELYDPEIVFFMDNLNQYTDDLEFRMETPKGVNYVTKFSSKDFNYATRWILYNADQQVSAFVLPATCRPEGYLAAKENGSLILLGPKESKHFKVTTGIE